MQDHQLVRTGMTDEVRDVAAHFIARAHGGVSEHLPERLPGRCYQQHVRFCVGERLPLGEEQAGACALDGAKLLFASRVSPRRSP